MSLSLRARVLLLISAVNALLFVGVGLYLRGRLHDANDRVVRYVVEDVLGAGVRSNIDPSGDVNVGPILSYEAWSILEDAILVGREGVEVSSDGSVTPRGIYLNPLGSGSRPRAFDVQEILAALVTVMEEGRAVDVAGGRAVPIPTAPGSDATWGGCWFRLEAPVDFTELFLRLVAGFLVATMLVAAGTFWTLGRLVLFPVEQLASGARRVRTGDFSVRLADPRRSDEVADLVRSFNEMTSTVQGFNEQLEDEVRRATEKARRAEAVAMTQRRLAAMGELAAGIAHEINNPLGGLQNAVEALGRDEIEPPKRRRYLELLSSGLARIGETVNRLRRFTPREAPAVDVDLTAVTADAVQLVQHRAERLGVLLDLEVAPEAKGAVVPGASNEIGQAILNLLVNSLDALEDEGSSDPTGPRIRVQLERASEPQPGLVVSVHDNGPGVSAEDQARVSDLFYTTKEVGKGTGLGLSLVHNTATKHGGDVRIASEHGAGFSVELFLPLQKGETRGGKNLGDTPQSMGEEA